MNLSLKGQRALVTGANSGIGAGVARALAEAGASVGANYVAHDEIARAVVREIQAGESHAMAIKADVSTGMQLQAAMDTTKLFPNMVIQMVAIGEEAGSLDAMLSTVADFFEAEVDDAVEALSSLMEPMIMVVLGTLIGGMVVAMYLPIFKMGQAV